MIADLTIEQDIAEARERSSICCSLCKSSSLISSITGKVFVGEGLYSSPPTWRRAAKLRQTTCESMRIGSLRGFNDVAQTREISSSGRDFTESGRGRLPSAAVLRCARRIRTYMNVVWLIKRAEA